VALSQRNGPSHCESFTAVASLHSMKRMRLIDIVLAILTLVDVCHSITKVIWVASPLAWLPRQSAQCPTEEKRHHCQRWQKTRTQPGHSFAHACSSSKCGTSTRQQQQNSNNKCCCTFIDTSKSMMSESAQWQKEKMTTPCGW